MSAYHYTLASTPETCFSSRMAQPTQNQINQLSFAFERFTRRFKVAEAAAAGENGLNALDAQTLVFISENANCSVGEVVRYLGVAPTTMSSAMNRLVRKGMIERRRSEENRRSVMLAVTKKGSQVVDHHKTGYRNACIAMLRALDTGEQNELIRLSEKIAVSSVE